MSRTRKGSKGYGYDFWSRRCNGDHAAGYGPVPKHETKRRERQQDRGMERAAMVDAYNYRRRFAGE